MTFFGVIVHVHSFYEIIRMLSTKFFVLWKTTCQQGITWNCISSTFHHLRSKKKFRNEDFEMLNLKNNRRIHNRFLARSVTRGVDEQCISNSFLPVAPMNVAKQMNFRL